MGLEARILAIRLCFWSQGLVFGLKAGFLASDCDLGLKARDLALKAWELGLKAGILASRLGFDRKAGIWASRPGPRPQG